MAASFNHASLAAILGLALSRLAWADMIDTAPAGGLSAREADALLSRFSPIPPYEPPLRLALALTSERPQAAQPPHPEVQEPPAVQLTPENRPLLPVTLARLRESDVKPPEPTPGTLRKKNETSAMDAARTWEIAPSDKTLNTTFARWSASAGWQLIWDLDVDYPIETRAVLEGTFEEAVAAVAQSLSRASVPIQATFYAGNKVLRIVAKGSK